MMTLLTRTGIVWPAPAAVAQRGALRTPILWSGLDASTTSFLSACRLVVDEAGHRRAG